MSNVLTSEHPTAMEIIEQRAALGIELRTTLFISEPNKEVIIAPLYQLQRGLYYEQETPRVVPFASPLDEIGRRAKVSLLLCKTVSMNLRDKKESDWPAYRSSRARSLKAFKADYVYMSVETVNNNIRLEGYPVGSEQIFVGAYVAPACTALNLGKLIMNMYRCCQQLAQTGLSSTFIDPMGR